MLNRILVVMLCAMGLCGCRSNYWSWDFDPFGLNDRKSWLPHDHPDRFDTNMREYIEQGYGFRLRDKDT